MIDPSHPALDHAFGPALLAEHGGVSAYHATWTQLLDVVREAGGCDALIVDAPYSERTHAGHDDGTETANAVACRARRGGRSASFEFRASKLARRPINYAAWSAEDVTAFVTTWSPLVRGWMASITDHVLAPSWAAAMEAAGRYVFAPLAFVSPGSRVRMTGDGPSQWSTFVVVSRPRSREIASWGALPGAYVLPPGEAEQMPVVGGKPLWLMRALVRDYTRPGDLVVDPCCGAGTTGLAARLEGRRAIMGDALLAHAEIAAERIRALPTAERKGTLALFGGER